MGNTVVTTGSSPEKYGEEAKKCIGERRYKDAVKYYYLFCLRTRQDIQCSTDNSNSAAMNIKELVFIPLLQSHQEEITKFLTSEYYLEIAKEVKTDTENDKLGDPTWVNKYGMSSFSGNRDTMHPPEKWKELRLKSIDDSITQLSSNV